MNLLTLFFDAYKATAELFQPLASNVFEVIDFIWRSYLSFFV